MPPVGTKNKPDSAAPDTSGAEQVEEEMSLEALVELDLKEEGIRVYSNGEQAKDPVAHLLGIRNEAISDGKKARQALIRADQATGLVATSMLKIRLSLRNPKTNLPDWGGQTKAYKDVIQGIIDAVKTPEESRATAANRLQRRTTRMLGQFVAEHVNETNSLGLDPEVVVATVKTAEKDGYETATKSEDEGVKALVAAVNEQFRAGKHEENEPYSPFEPKKGQQRTPATQAETQAADAVRNLSQFRQNLHHLTLDVVTQELVLINQEIAKIMRSKDPSPKFGKGRAAVANNLFAAGSIDIALAKEIADTKPSTAEREAAENALALTF